MRTTTLSLLFAALIWQGSAFATELTVLEDSQQSLIIEANFSDWALQESPVGGVILQPNDLDADYREGGPVTPYMKRLIGLPSNQLPRIVIEEAVWGDPVTANFAVGNQQADPAGSKQFSTLPAISLTDPVRWRNRWTSDLIIVPVRFEGNSARPLQRIRFRIEFGSRDPKVRRGSADLIADTGLLNGSSARAWTLPRKPLKVLSSDALKTSRATSALWQDGTMVRIEIDSEGMYAIDQQDLEQLGIDMTGIDPRQLRLFGNGGTTLPENFGLERDSTMIENAIIVAGEDDGSFDAEDRILFFGRAVNSWKPSSRVPGEYEHTVNPYVRRNVYWLFIPDAGTTQGLRMSQLGSEGTATAIASYARSRAFVDQDGILYSSGNDTESGTNWYATTLSTGQRYTVSVRVDQPLAESDAVLMTEMLVKSIGRYAVEINGVAVDTLYYSRYNRTTNFDASRLVNGTNTISIRLLDGLVYVNSLELTWQRELKGVEGRMEFDRLSTDGTVQVNMSEIDNPWVFDVEDFSDVSYSRGTSFTVDHQSNAPHRYIAIEDDRFLTPYSLSVMSVGGPEYPLGLREISSGADYVIITHGDFMQACAPLETYIEERDTIEVMRVDVADIYTEYGWGLADPISMRDFLADAYYRWDRAPQTVFFVGDGNYDPRNIMGTGETSYVPPYESGSYSYDDFFSSFTSTNPEMVNGRLPAQSAYQVEIYTEQLIQYESDPDYGPWRSRMVIVADDEYESDGVVAWDTVHMNDAEEFSREYAPEYLGIQKIYLGPYPTEFDAATGERRKPRVTEDLISAINEGSLIVSFIGHGNAHVWTHESVLVESRDDKLIDAGDRLPIFVAATCNWAHWDRPGNLSHPEILVTRRGGAIAVIAATRKTYPNQNTDFSSKFYEQFFDRTQHYRVGESLWIAKLNTYPGSPTKTYHILGEPRLISALPTRDVAVTQLDPDTLVAFGPATVSGQIASVDSPLDPTFDGELLLDIFDTVDTLVYTFHDLYRDQDQTIPVTLEWTRPGGRLFRGLVSVEGGEFSGRFIVPRDVRLGTSGAQVSMYGFTAGVEGSGSERGVAISNDVAELVDNTPPEINVYFDQPGWRSGDVTSSTPTLHLALFDTNGINLTGGIGHDILAVIDGDREIRLTDDFLYERNSYSRGNAQKQLLDLEPGEHTMEVWAWDIANNFSREEVQFTVLSGENEVVLANVLNWPNPFSNATNFTFELSAAAEVTIKIFTPAGRLIRELGPVQANAGFNYPGNTSSDFRWNGWDKYGDPIANGVYIYKVIADDGQGRRDEVIGKLLRVR